MAGPDIFLSYNREDADVARRFAEGFEAAGFEVWWDQALRSGEAYDEVTEEALRGARAVVVLWSPRSVVSRWVRAEASIADENGTLVPVKIEPCELPVMFRLTQTADLSGWQGAAEDKAWLALLGDVRRMVGKEPPEPIAKPAPTSVTAGDGIPVVAVLPITSRGGVEEMEFLAEDLTEEITRELSESFYCKVIAASTMSAWRGRTADHRALKRELDARYAIEGKLQGTGGNVRLTIQLIGTESDSALWSSRFTGRLDEIEEAPEQFPLSIAIELDRKIAEVEVARAVAKSPPCSAWEHILRAWAIGGGVSGNQGVEEARNAVSVAPDSGLARAVLARALSGRIQMERLMLDDTQRRDMVRESHDAIRQAMIMDGNNPLVLIRLAEAYGQLGEAEAGLRLARRAAELIPNSAEAQYTLGFAHFMLGHAAEAIEAFARQDRIGLSDNARGAGQALLGICRFIEGRPEEAEAALDRALSAQPTNYFALRWKAVVEAALGNGQSARATIRFMREVEPRECIDDYLDSLRHLPIEHPRKYEAIDVLQRLLEENEARA